MNVLFLTHRLPYAPNRGDRLRAYHMLRTLAPHCRVNLVSLVHDADEAAHVEDLAALAATVTTAPVSKLSGVVRAIRSLPTRRPLTHALLHAASLPDALGRIVAIDPPDVVLAYCSSMARFAMEPPLRGIPWVLDMIDVDSVKWAEFAGSSDPPMQWVYAREARCLSRFETFAAARADTTLLVNERERDQLALVAPNARAQVVPNGVDVEMFRPRAAPTEEPRVVFCGVMNYRPNEAAAVWLAREVWPLVRARYPRAQLTLVGASPTDAVALLAAADRSISVTGSVPDVRSSLWASAVAVAPLLIARGVQNKVLESIAAGLPNVVTPAVAAGLPAEVLRACLVASDAGEFAAAIGDLLDLDASARRSMAAGVDLERLSWARALAPLAGILDAAAVRGTLGRPQKRPIGRTDDRLGLDAVNEKPDVGNLAGV